MDREFVIHEHKRKKSNSTHWDFRLLNPSKTFVWSFAIPKQKFPASGERVLAIKTQRHSIESLNLKGKLKNGDFITVIDKGMCKIIKAKKAKILDIQLNGKRVKGHFIFIYLEKDKWLLIGK